MPALFLSRYYPALRPASSPLGGLGAEENPFRHEARLCNIDFGAAQDETIMVTLPLPAGY
ncbi:hypothetical protein IC235_01125 [Hymenobacter sp. BT664]|uniref:Uncharacterized protein n=1 Tax=Hymenobacter montanus TaxID=2771359 RepID=A0A927B9A2_9BACT|nr:hypothetical protein [Hymenobacter montanus]MBD2766490.1 hypothetical protein [Hymenobacter montanus]